MCAGVSGIRPQGLSLRTRSIVKKEAELSQKYEQKTKQALGQAHNEAGNEQRKHADTHKGRRGQAPTSKGTQSWHHAHSVMGQARTKPQQSPLLPAQSAQPMPACGSPRLSPVQLGVSAPAIHGSPGLTVPHEATPDWERPSQKKREVWRRCGDAASRHGLSRTT